jgi:hypothetical protein
LKNGLNIAELPEMGGWGGRFVRNADGYFSDAIDSFSNVKSARATVYRWRADFQNDWAARMDQCVKDYKDCNHAPVAVLNGSEDTNALSIKVKNGKTVILDASESFDPDNDELSFEWLFYPEIANLNETVSIKTEGKRAFIQLKNKKKAESLAIVLRVTDNGNPTLAGYKRIVIDFGL